MLRKYLAFDIETAAEVPGTDFNWRPYRPLGITCIGAFPCDAPDPITWHARNPDGSPAKRMTREEANRVLNYLQNMVSNGYTLLTWNGLGFDWDVLSEESGALDTCKELALNHVDMMFHVFCDRGFPVALDKAAQAMGIPSKPAGMSGLLAPQLWAQGRHQDVIGYVAQDVRIALHVAQKCETRRSFEWITREGTIGSMPLNRGWLTVRDALRLPEPDTSWMSDPLGRSDFADWLSRQ